MLSYSARLWQEKSMAGPNSSRSRMFRGSAGQVDIFSQDSVNCVNFFTKVDLKLNESVPRG